MSKKVLGLDVGSTSIGWALVEETGEEQGRIIAAGVRVFPEGVDRDQQGGEQSKSQTRRTARGMRRQLARRAKRKRQLRALLAEHRLLPASAEEQEHVLDANPYELRRRALAERLEPYEVGRVLMHLNQRRGFLSNRKTDKARASDTKGMLAEISELAGKIKESGCRTLGQYLAQMHGDFDHAQCDEHAKVRNRHTRRDMYEEEFDAVWKEQAEHHRDKLTDELKERVRRIIFFQRKMYWPKSVVGRCELERRERRCPRADRAAQRFRLLQEVNNLRVLDREHDVERKLTDEERARLLEYLTESKDRTFGQMRKKLGFGESVRFNLERGERDKLQGHQTDAALSAKKALGKDWAKLPDETKDAIVAVLIEEEREDVAKRQLVEASGLTDEQAERALGVNLPDGHMNFSKTAILRLLPHLERGLLLMAEDASNSALHAAGYLRPDERAVRQREFLPPAPDLPNPIVRQAMVEVRKVVNAIIREYGRPDDIHVELAREAKKSFEERRQIRFDNADRRKAREAAAEEIENHGVKPTKRTIDAYTLWLEQGEDCIYCGQKIGQAQLLGGEVDVDHILPRWRSLDNSLANKVVCHRRCNRDKGDRTPREWLETADPERYQRMLRVAEKLPYNKQNKLRQKEVRLDDFVNRQFTDTAYISRLVTQYLRCLGARVVTPRGQMTADLRHYWGLNTILDAEGRGEKNRADHRHHAVDALVIALTDHRRLHKLANFGELRYVEHAGEAMFPMPWADFRPQAEAAILGINVSHRALRRLRGALHEDTMYGVTQKGAGAEPGGPERRWAKGWVEQPNVYVRRKPIEALTDTKHLAKVRDETIREVLRAHLRERRIDPDQPGAIPKDAFKGANVPRMASGVPIKKVRMLEESETFRQVSGERAFHFVKLGNNHHIVYRAVQDGGDEKWVGEVVTMWDAAKRARAGQPIIDGSDNGQGRFVLSLSIGESFEVDGKDGDRHLCVVRMMDQRSKRIDFKLHHDARQSSEIKRDNLYLFPEKMRQLNATKVAIDPIGRVRTAHD